MFRFLNPLWVIDTFFTCRIDSGDDGGGSSQPTQQNVTQTNLPEYARPYFENLLNRTQALSYQQYQPYGGQRIAGFTPEQTQIQQDYANLQTPEQFAQAQQGMQGVGQLGMGAAGAGLGQALSYNPYSAQNFGGEQAAQYMSPYAEQALEPAMREARLQGNLAKQSGMLGSMSRGTFGGARQALLQAEQERGTQRNISDIYSTGMEKAYQNAQQQFNADQARRQQALQYAAGLGGQLFGQGINAGQQAATGIGALGATQQQADLNRLNAQQISAAQQQQMAQNQMDIAYQDFLRQRDYPQEQLGFYSNVLRGLPVQLASTSQTYQAAPSIGSQIGGLGLAGLSLSKLAG